MTKPEDKTGYDAQDDDSSDGEQDRPTVAPPFDPVAFAQEVLGGKPSPANGTPAVRPAGMPNTGALQGQSPGRKTPRGMGRAPMPTLTDPAELEDARVRSEGTARPGRTTPQGLLSLANARIPSNLPPRKESSAAFGGVDREWEELATRPPPPMQQDLIDSITRGDNGPISAPPSTKDAHALAASVAASASASRSMPAPPPSDPSPPTAQEMNDRVSLGDYTGALEIAESLLAINPDDLPVQICAQSCRGVLRQMYVTRVGPLDRVPVVMVARDQLRWLTIDHRAGFVLSLIDGVSSLDMILDVSGMPELDALRILSELAQQRIVSFR